MVLRDLSGGLPMLLKLLDCFTLIGGDGLLSAIELSDDDCDPGNP